MTLEWNTPVTPTSSVRTSLAWDEVSGEVRTPSSPLRPSEWLVEIGWQVVDGAAVPLALSILSGLPPHTGRSQWLEMTPKPITREVFKRLPVGEIVRRSRRMLPVMAEVPVLSELAEAASRTGIRNDWRYRETAKAYLEAQSDPRTLPGELALATWERLKQHPDQRLYTDDRVKVRKWIARARKLGYLPPS